MRYFDSILFTIAISISCGSAWADADVIVGAPFGQNFFSPPLPPGWSAPVIPGPFSNLSVPLDRLPFSFSTRTALLRARFQLQSLVGERRVTLKGIMACRRGDLVAVLGHFPMLEIERQLKDHGLRLGVVRREAEIWMRTGSFPKVLFSETWIENTGLSSETAQGLNRAGIDTYGRLIQANLFELAASGLSDVMLSEVRDFLHPKGMSPEGLSEASRPQPQLPQSLSSQAQGATLAERQVRHDDEILGRIRGLPLEGTLNLRAATLMRLKLAGFSTVGDILRLPYRDLRRSLAGEQDLINEIGDALDAHRLSIGFDSCQNVMGF